MRDERIKWIEDDLIKLFPHSWPTESSKFETLYLSRFKIPPEAKEGKMDDFEHRELFEKNGLKTGIVDIPTESEIIKMMSELSHGILDF